MTPDIEEANHHPGETIIRGGNHHHPGTPIHPGLIRWVSSVEHSVEHSVERRIDGCPASGDSA
jgi:hypothetical protein